MMFMAEGDIEQVHEATDASAESSIAAGSLEGALKKDDATAAAWEKRMAKTQESMQHIVSSEAADVAARKRETANLIKTKKAATQAAHKHNKEMREAMTSAAAKKARTVVAKVINQMSAQVKQQAVHAARAAAKGISKTKTSVRLAAASKRDAAAQGKMTILNKDVALLKAAVHKAMMVAAAARLAATRKSARFKAIVNTKVLRAKKDFEIMKQKLEGFKGSRRKQKATALKLRKLAQGVVRLSRRLKRKTRSVRHEKRRHKRQVKHAKVTAKRAKKKLKELLRHYKDKLQKLKLKLYAVRHSKGINAAMATRIASEQSVIAEQEEKLAELTSTDRRLKRTLHHEKIRIKVFSLKAKKRKKVLRIAHKAYSNLSRALAHLQSMAAQRAKTVIIKARSSSDKKSAKKVEKQMKRAVEQAAAGAKAVIAASVAKKAARAAKREARKAARAKLGVAVPGLNSALRKANSSLKGLGKQPATTSENTSGPHPLKTISKVVHKGRTKVSSARVKLAKIKAVKSDPAILLEEGATPEDAVHDAVVLAHVAHELFKKAQLSGLREDKTAAKEAMKRAIAARKSLRRW